MVKYAKRNEDCRTIKYLKEAEKTGNLNVVNNGQRKKNYLRGSKGKDSR